MFAIEVFLNGLFLRVITPKINYLYEKQEKRLTNNASKE